ncbi:hypothetical protein VTJ04DRAFT_3028 [Mycothermus thermophilus]|uniref:uncharacterized protein n=1 Tax=Humicola insolens TaxID=85995 RepID=UPI003742B74F
MALAKYIQLALLGAALISSAEATKNRFNACVSNCIAETGCVATNAWCVCNGARRSNLLSGVISCLFLKCEADLRNVENSFLDPIEDFCDDKHRDIPKHKLKSAETLASSYISRLNTPTPTPTATPKPQPPTTTNAPQQPTPTSTQKPQVPTQTENKTSTSSSPDRGQETSSSSSKTGSDRGLGESTSSSAATPTSSSQPDAAITDDNQPDPTPDNSQDEDSGSIFDTNPFGTPRSVGSATSQPLVMLLALPLFVMGALMQR